jgi:IS5 family transposase
MKQETMRYRMVKKQLRCEKFLGEMDKIVPFNSLINIINPHYKNSDIGRNSHPLELMLRIYLLQLWYNLSDPAMEDAIYDRFSFQKFLGFDIFGGNVPDESSILRFRHLLEQNNLAESILLCINSHLASKGLVYKTGTIVDATILEAPVNRKNSSGERDAQMSSTKKNNKWHFGAKAHIGVQSEGKPIVHSVEFSTAKDHDITHMEKLFHGDEAELYGDSAYHTKEGKEKAKNDNKQYLISQRAYRNRPLSNEQKMQNSITAKIRAKVEHPFRVVKVVFGHTKLKYKGLFKNAVQYTVLFALSNLYLCRKLILTKP